MFTKLQPIGLLVAHGSANIALAIVALCNCLALVATLMHSPAASASTQAAAPARSASALPSRVHSPGAINRPGSSGAQIDKRSAIVEANLRSVNRSLDASRPASPDLPAPSPCPSCGERAKVQPSERTRATAEATQRSSLHKLRRETAIQQSTDERRTRIEASQPD